MSNTVEFWRRYAQAYDRVMSAYTRHKSLVLEHAKGLEGYHRVLDSGCGPGHLAKELLDRGHEVHALDINPEAIRLATEKCANHFGLTTIVRDATVELPFDNEYFDGVSSMLLLWAVRNPRDYLLEHRRVLRPSGCLVLSGPGPETKATVDLQLRRFKEDLERQGLFPGIQESWDDFIRYTGENIGHTGENWFTQGEVRDLLTTTGYSVLSIKPNPIYLDQGHIVTATKI